MTEQSLPAIYQDELDQLKGVLQRLLRQKSQLAWLRLGTFLATVVMTWLLWGQGWQIAILVFIVLFGVFLFVVSKDLANKDAIENATLLTRINQLELSALNHQFIDFPDGHQWQPEQHDYAHDLDIFGRASLFQYINRTSSEQGGWLLSRWLLAPASSGIIDDRQKAAKELSQQKAWRQQLQAYGISKPLTRATEKNITEWLKEKNIFINNSLWKIVRFLLPAVSFAVLILHIAGIIPPGGFYTLMLLFLAISFSISKYIMPAYNRLNRITSELETLSSSIGWIENAGFQSPLLQQLKNKYGTGNEKASITIRRLKKILDRLDYRLNPVVFIPLSIFFYWDLQQIFALEKWKVKNQMQIGEWFASLASFEALSSLGNLAFNHPQWCFPILSPNESVFKAENLGHPLIPANKRVDNSFSSEGKKQVNLVTGSNMAGKSTFLRSVGVNIVLAMMGAPVCARQLTLSPMKVMSSMRISDNLEESTSTFYAELKKLKGIIEAVNKGEKVFLLLDEILRGTNSADRHTGSKALIRQLIHHYGSGLVATHDLELAKLAEEYPANIHNYHFDVQVENDELYFDYKLKEGICRSMNASILMKKIGIEL
jgi:hypothetical protein